MKIFLIGFMGSGKSTVGKQLAGSLGLTFLDTDEIIEREKGMSIIKIFEEFGEEKFRIMEHELLQEIVKRDNLVISTGGGVPCYHNNMELINGNGISIYLRMGSAALAGRIEHDKAVRPLVRDRSGKELIRFISDKLREREKFYLQAQHVVDGLNIKLEKLLTIINS